MSKCAGISSKVVFNIYRKYLLSSQSYPTAFSIVKKWSLLVHVPACLCVISKDLLWRFEKPQREANVEYKVESLIKRFQELDIELWGNGKRSTCFSLAIHMNFLLYEPPEYHLTLFHGMEDGRESIPMPWKLGLFSDSRLYMIQKSLTFCDSIKYGKWNTIYICIKIEI